MFLHRYTHKYTMYIILQYLHAAVIRAIIAKRSADTVSSKQKTQSEWQFIEERTEESEFAVNCRIFCLFSFKHQGVLSDFK